MLTAKQKIMKKQFLKNLILLFCVTIFYSQNTQIKTTKSRIFQDEFIQSNLILSEKTHNNELVIIRSYKDAGLRLKEGIYIEKYNSNLELKSEFSYPIEHPITHKYATLFGLYTFEDKVRFVEIYYDLKIKSLVCVSHQINADLTTQQKNLFEIPIEKVKILGNLNLESKN